MKRLLIIMALAIGFTIVVVKVASAQQPTPSDDEVNAIASQLYCPVCENTPLDVCPTTACHDWRELIRQMLADGKTPDEIKQYFVDHYGARVLGKPPAAGFNWLIYVVPPVVFLLGIFLLVQAFRLWRRKPVVSEAPISIVDSVEGNNDQVNQDYVSRLEEELRKRK